MTPSAPLIDPTPEELAAQLDAAAVSPGRDWGKVVAAMEGRREGVGVVDAADPYGVCWWTDRLGRRHCALHGNRDPLRVGGVSVGWSSTRHPLEWIAPPLASGWRGRSGRREFVVICRCGVVGTPESVGWMGQTCGPCHDREQEGVTTTSLPAGGIHRIHLAPSGRLVVVQEPGLGPDRYGPAQTALTAYAPPWEGPPLWERSWEGCRPVAASEDLVAVADEGELDLIDARDGTYRRTFRTGPETILQLAFAGPGRRTVVALDPDRLRFWDTNTAVDHPRHVSRGSHPIGCILGVTHDGSRVVRGPGVTEAPIEVYEVASGRLIDRLENSFAADFGGHACLADGSFCLLGLREATWVFRHWSPGAPPGFLATLFGPAARRPDRVSELGHCSLLATDGERLLTRDGDALHVLEGRSLRSLGTFSPGRGLFPTTAAFAPGGALILSNADTLVVWPWRELFAVE